MPLRPDIELLSPARDADIGIEAINHGADAVYIGGNGLRAVGVIQALETELGRPVLTANQVLFWNLLRLAGTRVPVENYGRLFALDLPA